MAEGLVKESTFRIGGMDCASCAVNLEKIVGNLPSVHEAVVNYGAAKMNVRHDDTTVNEIIQAVERAGYNAVEESGELRSTVVRGGRKKIVITSISSAMFLMAWIPSLVGASFISEKFVIAIYAIAIVIGGYPIARKGLFALKSRVVGIELLMTIAVAGAAAIGEWQEGAAVVVLFSIGEALEGFTMERTRRSIRRLMDLAPTESLVRRDGVEMRLTVEKIKIGDILVIKPGEKIAMDGKVMSGISSINQAPITGESIPVYKSVGDEVFAGTINQQGALEVEVTRLLRDNTLSRIIQMVEEAQAQKAPSQRFVDSFAKYYTPAVVALAIGVAIVPPLLFHQAFEDSLYRALMLLVVSCPCALIISTPVSIVAAIGHAAKQGILVKGGAHMERLGKVRTIAFDKTGTLTTGIPEVTEVIAFTGISREELLTTAASIEVRSEHSIAGAIVRQARAEGLTFAEAVEFSSVTGHGAQAKVRDEWHYIGSPRWFHDERGVNLEPEVREAIERREASGQTVVLLGREESILGMICVADEMRADSAEVVRKLRHAGIANIVMLTGDNRGTAEAIAAKAGGMDYKAELLPQHKAECIRQLMQEGPVAMVGDGINDAPALAEATVGIAMGAGGTHAAMETADITLMGDDLNKLPYAVHLSRRTLRIIQQNVVFSVLVKVAFLLLIFLGHSELWMAVLADTGATILVIANGMRLLRGRKRYPAATSHKALFNNYSA